MSRINIPKPSLERLPRYYRAICLAAEQGERTISSESIGQAVGVNVVQVRKDLAYFGGLGRPGVGYDVLYLIAELSRILGIEQSTTAILVGVGHLGVAIANYHGFGRYHVNLRALFDRDSQKIGTVLSGGAVIKSIVEMPSFLDQNHIDLGIITVPVEVAQSVAEIMVDHGIKAIWNFAPMTLRLDSSVTVRNEDLTTGLVTLCYHLRHKDQL